MKNPIDSVKEYINDKVDAWKNKHSFDLCNENPVLFELKWTGTHWKHLYNTTFKKKEPLRALKYDFFVTGMRGMLYQTK